MNTSELEGKSLAVVLWTKDGNGEDEVFVVKTIFQREENNLIFEIPSNLYEKNAKKLKLVLDDEWIKRLNRVPDDLKETLKNADFSLSLLIGDLPEN
jgi:hypothetical protein